MKFLFIRCQVPCVLMLEPTPVVFVIARITNMAINANVIVEPMKAVTVGVADGKQFRDSCEFLIFQMNDSFLVLYVIYIY